MEQTTRVEIVYIFYVFVCESERRRMFIILLFYIFRVGCEENFLMWIKMSFFLRNYEIAVFFLHRLFAFPQSNKVLWHALTAVRSHTARWVKIVETYKRREHEEPWHWQSLNRDSQLSPTLHNQHFVWSSNFEKGDEFRSEVKSWVKFELTVERLLKKVLTHKVFSLLEHFYYWPEFQLRHCRIIPGK